jgi:hypothetical protein
MRHLQGTLNTKLGLAGRLMLPLAAVVAIVLGVNAAPAQASAGGCNGILCIAVNGSGQHVNYVRATVEAAVFTGHIEFSDSDGHLLYNTAHATWDQGGFVTLTVNTSYPVGDQICVTAWDLKLRDLGRPCETIG